MPAVFMHFLLFIFVENSTRDKTSLVHFTPFSIVVSVLIFVSVLQTDGAAAAAVGFQKGSPIGGWRSGESTGDFQTMDLLIFYFVTNAGSQSD